MYLNFTGNDLQPWYNSMVNVLCVAFLHCAAFICLCVRYGFRGVVQVLDNGRIRNLASSSAGAG